MDGPWVGYIRPVQFPGTFLWRNALEQNTQYVATLDTNEINLSSKDPRGLLSCNVQFPVKDQCRSTVGSVPKAQSRPHRLWHAGNAAPAG